MRWAVLGAGLILGVALASCATAQTGEQAVDAGLIKLHDDLRLSGDQERAWRDYTTALQPTPEMEARHRAAERLLPVIPTPRRIALVEANMESDLADMRRQGQAVRAFYDTLTPAQQRTFDQETAQQGSEASPPLSSPPSPAAPSQPQPRPSRAPSAPQVMTPPRTQP